VPSAVTKKFSQAGSGFKGSDDGVGLEHCPITGENGGDDFPVGSPVWPWAVAGDAGAAEAAAARRIFSRQFICGKGGGAPAWDTGGEGA